MAFKAVGSSGVIAISNAAARNGEKFAHQGEYLRVFAQGTAAHVTVGSTVTAAVTDFYVPKDSEAVISIGRPASNRVTGITKGSPTTIDFAEGTGCPFYQGQNVSLTVSGNGTGTQSNFDFTEKPVASINNTSDVNGYFSTRITVTYDSSAGSVPTVLDAPFAELRDTLVVGAIRPTSGSDTGNIFYQQVQITGDS